VADTSRMRMLTSASRSTSVSRSRGSTAHADECSQASVVHFSTKNVLTVRHECGKTR
jgi:hypothetical protein